jgi:hypothetical protein
MIDRLLYHRFGALALDDGDDGFFCAHFDDPQVRRSLSDTEASTPSIPRWASA